MKMQSGKRALDKIYKRRDRYDIPEWQRQEVWSHSKKQNLIDTVLRGWKLPKFYFQKTADAPDTFEVVDGQQRLATIFEFFDDDLSLSDASAKMFGGRTYTELPDRYSDLIDDYEIEYDEIEEATEEEVKQFFQRLQEGLPLTSSEKLNSIHSNLRDFVMRSTKHHFFSKVAASDRRRGHFDIMAKATAIEIDGIEVSLRYDDLRAVFESQTAFSSDSNIAYRLNGTLDFVDKGFTEQHSNLLRNRTIIQSLLTLVNRLTTSEKMEGKEQQIANFFTSFSKELNRQVELGHGATDPEYPQFQRTVNANVRTGARTRQEILLRKLFAYDPSFAEMLDPAVANESGIQTAVRNSAANIVALVSQINEQYAGQNGSDLFKPTNKTVQAQISIGEPVRNYDQYKLFIEDLYFLFHEGVGNRLDDSTPRSFKDVNLLRTNLQHDLDHGGKGKVKHKRQQVGKAFEKYAGVMSPETLDPEKFVIAQNNILTGLEYDLRSLKW